VLLVQETSRKTFLDGLVSVLVGDITAQNVDAIVNAANSSLLGGGGVDGAIHRKGGPEILAECRLIRKNLYALGLPTGEAVLTGGGKLPARHVIHTVGPIYGASKGRDAELLANCYRRSLALCAQHNLTSVAFPAISTGVYGYPREAAAKVSSRVIKEVLPGCPALKDVRLVFFSEDDFNIFLENHEF
jgi:O-acetyl-ADP-ribose deacetylase (regulator of RNase III)